MTSSYSYPKTMKKLRACIECKLLKTEGEWIESKLVCDNCGNIREDQLTSNHKGIIAFTEPQYSWAAKWLNRTDIIPGLYCLHVEEMDEDFDEEYENDIEDEEEI